MQVDRVMTSAVECCTGDTTLRDAAKMMVDCDCGLIPVVQDLQSRRLTGVITDRDICCRAVANGWDVNSATVEKCMSVDIQTARPDTSVEECAQMMERAQVRRIPVVSQDGSVIGIVSQADIALSQPPTEAGQVVKRVSQPYVS